MKLLDLKDVADVTSRSGKNEIYNDSQVQTLADQNVSHVIAQNISTIFTHVRTVFSRRNGSSYRNILFLAA